MGWLIGSARDSFPRRIAADERCAIGIVDFDLGTGRLQQGLVKFGEVATGRGRKPTVSEAKRSCVTGPRDGQPLRPWSTPNGTWPAVVADEPSTDRQVGDPVHEAAAVPLPLEGESDHDPADVEAGSRRTRASADTQ